MIKKDKAVIAFLAGANGALFLLAFTLIFKIPIPNSTNLLALILCIFFTAGLLEEGIKFLLVKRWGEFPYYCIFLGLGYGFFEQYFRHGVWIIVEKGFGDLLSLDFLIKPSFGFVMQIIMAVILAYFIKKQKPVFGLAFAIITHTLIDVLLCIK